MLQERPHTFARTNPSFPFFACNDAADYIFRIGPSLGHDSTMLSVQRLWRSQREMPFRNAGSWISVVFLGAAAMPFQQTSYDRTAVNRALEIAINLGLAILLTAACLLILLPFIPLLTWGIIIAVAAYPGFKKLQHIMGGHSTWAAAVFTVVLLAVLIVPVFFLADSLIAGVQTITSHVKAGDAIIPPPPPNIGSWPIIGAPLNKAWLLASQDLSQLLKEFAPQLRSALPGVLSATAGLGATVLQLLLSIIVSGVILANARAAYELTRSLAIRLFGEKGPEFQDLVGSTIRSVTFGIIGVAFIQSVCATLGFLVAGLPAVGLWAVVFLIAAVLQFGALVLVPAVVYVFVTATTTKAVIFLIW